MNNIEFAWQEFTEQISKLKVLKNIIEHSAEVQINQYKKMGSDYDTDIKRYHHGINFVKHKHVDNKPYVISIETKSFNINEYIALLEEQHNEQYKLVLAKAYESFKKFIKDIFGNENEVNILINNNYKDVYHESFNINLFYVINIIRIMRNKISHNETINDENIICNEIEKILNKQNLCFQDTDKEVLLSFTKKFIDSSNGIILREKKLQNGGHWNRIGVLIDCLLSYSYHIKETKT
ncbi:MAG: hypothetical protein M0R46_17930 [Candidatus Muirbacterium halophilum]|nr:hypothetical protein [Candidatus Muirbacterium halophilum]